jgi:hypothetical protein
MAKLFNEPVQVHTDKDSTPDAFIWRKRLYRVEGVMGWWRQPSAWWDGEPERLFLRVSARNGTAGIYELCQAGDRWFLHRLLD